MNAENNHICEEESPLDVLNMQLADLAQRMKPMHLKMATALADGKTQDESYVTAGGKGKNPRKAASDLIRTNPDISTYVSTAKAIASLGSLEQLIGTVDQKRRMLWSTAQTCTKTWIDKDGNKRMFGASEAVRAIGELNKMDGDLAAIINKNEVTHKFADLTDAELDKRIAALKSQ